MIISWVYSLNGFRITVVFNCVKVQPKKRFVLLNYWLKQSLCWSTFSINTAQNSITLFFESNMLTDLKESYVTIIPWYSQHNWYQTELNINVSLQGNLKKRRESGLMTHKVGPKQRKGNDKERIQRKCPISPPAKGPFGKAVIRQQRKGLQWRKLGLSASALMFKKPWRTSMTINFSQRRHALLPLYFRLVGYSLYMWREYWCL